MLDVEKLDNYSDIWVLIDALKALDHHGYRIAGTTAKEQRANIINMLQEYGLSRERACRAFAAALEYNIINR